MSIIKKLLHSSARYILENQSDLMPSPEYFLHNLFAISKTNTVIKIAM